MAEKQDLKVSEARILVYLDTAAMNKRFVKAISNKLDIDYSYLLNILGRMAYKGWVVREVAALRSYYHIKEEAPLQEAKDLLSKDTHIRGEINNGID